MNEKGYEVTPHGLRIDRALSLEEWCMCGAALVTAATRIGWAIGDWLIYGAGRGDYGEYYQQAQAITGRSLEALSQYARVSRAFPAQDRGIAVPWSFYREALRLPAHDRTPSLQVAAENQWTRDGLAVFISTRAGATPSAAAALTERPLRQQAKTHAADGARGWKPPTHRKVMMCPQCGCCFEPKRQQRRHAPLLQRVESRLPAARGAGPR